VPDARWKPDKPQTDAIRERAEVNYLPGNGIWKKDAVSPRHSFALSSARARAGCSRPQPPPHFCIITNRSDPRGGSGLDLIRRHRKKAGTIEHAHDVLMNNSPPPAQSEIRRQCRPGCAST
jgi:hypothetical protein